MNRQTLLLIVATAAVLGSGRLAWAGHNLGGSLGYSSLGGDSFRVTMHLYFDCSSAGSTAPDTLYYQPQGGSAATALFALQSSTDTQYVCKGTPYGYCMRHCVYTAVIHLSGNAQCQWLLWVDMCCRNTAVRNMNSPSKENLYLQAGLNKCVANASPVFAHSLSSFAFTGKSQTTDLFAASDADGDSLVYRIVTPKGKAGMATYYPANADSFSLAYPLGKKATCVIDSGSGLLLVNCGLLGQFALCVEVAEYRADSAGAWQQIGMASKDITLVTQLWAPHAPLLPPDKNATVCAGEPVCFYNVPTTDLDTLDSVFVTIAQPATLPAGVSFSTQWQGRHQHFSLCWHTAVPDSSLSPLKFVVKATDDGCFFPATASMSFTVNVQASRFMPPLPDTALCRGDTITLEAKAQGVSFQWNTGHTTAALPVWQPGLYTCTLTHTASGCTQTDSVMVMQLYPSHPSFAINGAGLTFQFTADTGSAAGYLWQFGDGGSDTGRTVWHTYSTPGSYTVSLTETSLNGCDSTVQQQVAVTGLRQAGQGVSVYPNPFTENVIIATYPSEHGMYSILNTLGQPLWQQSILAGGQVSIASSSWPSGLYVLHTPCGQVHRLVKE